MKTTRHHGADATNETAPWLIWESAVFEIAGCSVEDGRSAATAERIRLWYRSGEPAWMAADALRAFVVGARKAATEDDGRSVIRAAHRASLASRRR